MQKLDGSVSMTIQSVVGWQSYWSGVQARDNDADINRMRFQHTISTIRVPLLSCRMREDRRPLEVTHLHVSDDIYMAYVNM
jgi:hypothetical protein